MRATALTPDQVALIRMILGQDRALRDLALFNTALDTSFRGSDLVRLRVSDVATPAGVREIVEIRQKKTESRNARPVQARLSSGTRDSLRAYLAASEKQMHAWLFGIVNLSGFAEEQLVSSRQAAFSSHVMPSQML